MSNLARFLYAVAAFGGCIAALSLPVNAASVECSSEVVYFKGDIGDSDYQKILKACNGVQFTKSLPFVISSPGGKLSEAMKIGRWVRAKKLTVVVPNTANCFSSCVHILAAGVVKWPWGDVGIHRPYFQAAPAQGFDAALKSVLLESRAYFKEMNIPEVLADDMFSVPPEKLQLLGDELLDRYRLNQDDMAYAEERDIANAAAYGLTRSEYMARRELAEKYGKQCLERIKAINGGEVSTSEVVRCGDQGYKRARLVLKTE